MYCSYVSVISNHAFLSRTLTPQTTWSQICACRSKLLYARKRGKDATKTSLEKIPLKARMMESQLYKNSASLEAYLNRSTLKQRLGRLASAITSHYKKAAQGSGASKRSSTVSVSSLASLEGAFADAQLRRRESASSTMTNDTIESSMSQQRRTSSQMQRPIQPGMASRSNSTSSNADIFSNDNMGMLMNNNANNISNNGMGMKGSMNSAIAAGMTPEQQQQFLFLQSLQQQQQFELTRKMSGGGGGISNDQMMANAAAAAAATNPMMAMNAMMGAGGGNLAVMLNQQQQQQQQNMLNLSLLQQQQLFLQQQQMQQQQQSQFPFTQTGNLSLSNISIMQQQQMQQEQLQQQQMQQQQIRLEQQQKMQQQVGNQNQMLGLTFANGTITNMMSAAGLQSTGIPGTDGFVYKSNMNNGAHDNLLLNIGNHNNSSSSSSNNNNTSNMMPPPPSSTPPPLQPSGNDDSGSQLSPGSFNW
jgi:hypothetical protein